MPKNEKVLDRKLYTLSVSGKAAELTLYGEIVETQPKNFWTGEPVDGQFIVLKDFLADLNDLKGVETLTIHLNSAGGDAYSSVAIHNRLRELQNTGMEVTCIVDGVAMSGGSLIMCACDTVKVNPSSIIMIHDCWCFLWDMMNSGDLQKLAGELDVIDNSQAEIYARKSGQSLDTVREMMDETTFLSGRQAVEYGFADEVLDDAEEPDIAVSADHSTLRVGGHSMRIAAMGKLPDGIRVKEIETVPETDGGDKKTPESSGRNEGGIPMTLDELRQSDPEAAEALLAEAQASVSHEEAVNAERQRLAEIDEIASLYDAETVRSAKYGENPCTAQEMAFRAAQEMAKTGRTFMEQLNADANESGADDVPAAPAAEDADAPMTPEQLMAAGRNAVKNVKEGN